MKLASTLFLVLVNLATHLITIEAEMATNQDIEHYSPVCTYDDIDPSLLISIAEDNGTTTNYQYDSISKQVIAEFTNQQNVICKRRFFHYNAEGKLATLVVDDGTSLEASDLTNASFHYETTFSYCQEGAACGLLEEIEEKRLSLNTGNLYCVNRISNIYDSLGVLKNQSISSGSKKRSDILLCNSPDLSIGDYFHRSWDSLMHSIFDRGFLQFSGYYHGKTTSGTYRSGNELHDKIRISAINGILNISADMEIILKKLSDTHGGITIHYVFRSTEGWTKDLLNCTFIKFGYVSEPACLLAEKWKGLIQEMGGVDGGGKILHYAHSIGATDTYTAKCFLSSEEQKMIHVITLGSPSLIPSNVGFGSVANYVSKRDAVCLFDPIGYLKGLTTADSNVYFLGSAFGMPEHTMYAESYIEAIERFGYKFVEEHKQTK